MKFKLDPERYQYYERPKAYYDIIIRKDGIKWYYIKSIDHFHDVLKRDSRSQQNKRYFYSVLKTIKDNNSLATEKQKIVLDRIKTGNRNYSKINEVKLNVPFTPYLYEKYGMVYLKLKNGFIEVDYINDDYIGVSIDPDTAYDEDLMDELYFIGGQFKSPTSFIMMIPTKNIDNSKYRFRSIDEVKLKPSPQKFEVTELGKQKLKLFNDMMVIARNLDDKIHDMLWENDETIPSLNAFEWLHIWSDTYGESIIKINQINNIEEVLKQHIHKLSDINIFYVNVFRFLIEEKYITPFNLDIINNYIDE